MKILEGRTISSLIRQSECSTHGWLMLDIETVTDRDAPELGDLLHRLAAAESLGSGVPQVEVDTTTLYRALDLANQVWCLDIRCVLDGERRLIIEDGVMWENSL